MLSYPGGGWIFESVAQTSAKLGMRGSLVVSQIPGARAGDGGRSSQEDKRKAKGSPRSQEQSVF